jgi:hypothetical protein
MDAPTGEARSDPAETDAPGPDVRMLVTLLGTLAADRPQRADTVQRTGSP